MFRIVEDDGPLIPERCSDMLRNFLEQCFQKDPSLRPSAEMLCEHPWLKHNWVALQVYLVRFVKNVAGAKLVGHRTFDYKIVFRSSDESVLICRSLIGYSTSREWTSLTHLLNRRSREI